MVPNCVPYGPRHVRMVWVLATFVVGSRKWPNLTPQPRPFLAPVASFGHRWGTLVPKVAQIAPFRAHFGPKLSLIVPRCSPGGSIWGQSGFNLGSFWLPLLLLALPCAVSVQSLICIALCFVFFLGVRALAACLGSLNFDRWGVGLGGQFWISQLVILRYSIAVL